MYSQVTMNESIDLWHVLMIDSSQDNYEENHHERWQPPAQKAKEQVSPLGVFITHHQHVPEVHRLEKEATWAGSGLMVQDIHSAGIDKQSYPVTKVKTSLKNTG